MRPSVPDVVVEWRGHFESPEVEALHSEGFAHAIADYDWRGQVERHSLGWVCARMEDRLIGWVNLAWDGAEHAFLLDTLVAETARRRGVATRLVAVAVDHARAEGCEWLHVDFDAELAPFYAGACGFRPTPAAIMAL